MFQGAVSREGDSMDIEEFNNKSEDEIILHYLHKKFRLNDVLQQRVSLRAETGGGVEESGGVIRTVRIKTGRPPSQEEEQEPPCESQPAPVRKSVIVRREEARTELEIQTDQMMISLNVEELENLFTQEEENFFHHSLAHFASCWRAIPQVCLNESRPMRVLHFALRGAR